MKYILHDDSTGKKYTFNIKMSYDDFMASDHPDFIENVIEPNFGTMDISGDAERDPNGNWIKNIGYKFYEVPENQVPYLVAKIKEWFQLRDLLD